MNVNVQIADIWPEWEVIDEIGSGYYGRVYSIKRSDYIGTYYAAMKVISIPKEQAEIDFLLGSGMDERSVTEYLHDYADKICREIALMEELKGNTNIVSYEDHKVVWRSDGTGCNIYIRMQLLTPLLTYIKTHNMLTDDILQLGCDICHALELCEKKKILHRDIKPENIFISNDGDYKLGDFGTARVADATTHGTVAGTFFYMAPEVHKNERYNATVDIYSLGLVLYQFLNKGRLPFMPPASEKIQYGDMNAAFSMRVSGEKIPPIPDVSKELSQIICKACSYESKDRYQTATEFRQDLMEIKEILAMSAQEYNPADNDETISQEKEKPEIDLDWNKHEGTVSIFGGKEIEADSNPISEWCVVDSNPLPELFQKEELISAEQIYESNPELVLKAKTDLLLKKEKKGLFSGVVGLMKSAFGHSKTEKSKSESELHTFKGDLAPKETVVSAKAEALPKVITETPDQDTSDAVVLFKQADCYFDGWICGECDTENKAGRQYCVVCGSNQEKRG